MANYNVSYNKPVLMRNEDFGKIFRYEMNTFPRPIRFSREFYIASGGHSAWLKRKAWVEKLARDEVNRVCRQHGFTAEILDDPISSMGKDYAFVRDRLTDPGHYLARLGNEVAADINNFQSNIYDSFIRKYLAPEPAALNEPNLSGRKRNFSIFHR
jgi:hypothetical protein